MAQPTNQMGSNRAIGFQPHAQQLLSGYWLEQGNPYAQGLLDAQRRQAETTLASRQAQLDEASRGAGRFGGSMYQNMARQAFGTHQQQLAEQQNATLAALHEAERGRMMTALGQLGGFETAAADRLSREKIAQQQAASAAAAAQANAQLQREMQAAQLGFSREELEVMAQLQQQGLAAQVGMHGLDAWTQRALQAAGLEFGRDQLAADLLTSMGQLGLGEAGILSDLGLGMGGQQLGALGLGGQMAGLYGDQQLGALSMVPGLEQAGYYGLGQALGAQGRLGGAGSAADQARYQQEYNRWLWETQNEQNALFDYLGALGAVGGMGGTTDAHGLAAPNTQIPSASPVAGAIMGGLGGFLAGRGMGGMGMLGGGGNLASAGVWDPYPGRQGVPEAPAPVAPVPGIGGPLPYIGD